MLTNGQTGPLRQYVLRASMLAAAACLAMIAAPTAWAQDFPNRAVKIIVPFPAGGTADAVPRLVADWLSQKWGQPVIIDNRSGAGGNIGAEAAFRSDPDGYTLLSAPPPPLVINQNLYPNLAFDPTKFEPIVVLAQVPNTIVVNPDKIAAKTVPEFLAHLKANPGKVTSATQGNGTTSHLTSEMLQMMGGVQVQHIPYRGSAPALQGLLGGEVDFMCDNLGSSLGLVQAGKLRLLGVASDKRLESLPNVPTIAETLPGFSSVAWYAVVAPPKTPKAIVEKINADINEALRQPEIRDRLKKIAAEVVGGSTDATAKYLREEIQRWDNVIKKANVKISG
jgi:tripartite-type tricarboxylate transporter receptor subunit TctC